MNQILENESNKFSNFLKNQWIIQNFDNFHTKYDILKGFRILSYLSRIFGQKLEKIYKCSF